MTTPVACSKESLDSRLYCKQQCCTSPDEALYALRTSTVMMTTAFPHSCSRLGVFACTARVSKTWVYP